MQYGVEMDSWQPLNIHDNHHPRLDSDNYRNCNNKPLHIRQYIRIGNRVI